MRRGLAEKEPGAPLQCGESVEHHWIKASPAAGSPFFRGSFGVSPNAQPALGAPAWSYTLTTEDDHDWIAS
jgi:hypothetical protein